MTIDPLPVPPDVHTAVRLANERAYGFAKHTDDGYWDRLYLEDPAYCWDRMLGWQAEGGPDEARYGRWAVPPSPWHDDHDPGDPSPGDGGPIDAPPPAPPASDALEAVAVTLRSILQRLDAQDQDFAAFRQEVETFTRSVGRVSLTGTVSLKTGKVTLHVQP